MDGVPLSFAEPSARDTPLRWRLLHLSWEDLSIVMRSLVERGSGKAFAPRAL